MGAMSRRKGKVGERELAAALSAAGFPAHRGVQYHGGPESPDVVCECLPGVHWEVKRTERLHLYAALQQATNDAHGRVPIVAHRANGSPWVAILRLDDLLAILWKSSHVVQPRDSEPSNRGTK